MKRTTWARKKDTLGETEVDSHLDSTLESIYKRDLFTIFKLVREMFSSWERWRVVVRNFRVYSLYEHFHILARKPMKPKSQTLAISSSVLLSDQAFIARISCNFYNCFENKFPINSNLTQNVNRFIPFSWYNLLNFVTE